MTDDLLTDAEVAAVLRKSARTVKAMRLGGRLAYLPGKPPLVRRSELDAYLRRTIVVHPPRRVAPPRIAIRMTKRH